MFVSENMSLPIVLLAFLYELSKDKHSSLFCWRISEEEIKKFYGIDEVVDVESIVSGGIL